MIDREREKNRNLLLMMLLKGLFNHRPIDGRFAKIADSWIESEMLVMIKVNQWNEILITGWLVLLNLPILY